MNTITLVGRLTKDPQSREAGSSNVVSFSVAVDNWGGKDKGTSFFDVQAWSKTGDFVSNYLKKGDQVVVSGRMESRKHEDKTYWTVTANEVKSVGGVRQKEEESFA
jgi:single-strand DNA-binding protein